jgi:hypothetical protein
MTKLIDCISKKVKIDTSTSTGQYIVMKYGGKLKIKTKVKVKEKQ